MAGAAVSMVPPLHGKNDFPLKPHYQAKNAVFE